MISPKLVWRPLLDPNLCPERLLYECTGQELYIRTGEKLYEWLIRVLRKRGTMVQEACRRGMTAGAHS
jgi:hypothetical protein